MFDASVDIRARFCPPPVVCSRVVHLHNVAKTVMEYVCGLSENLCMLLTDCIVRERETPEC